MTAIDIIGCDTLKRLTTDLARHLPGIDGEAVELLETQNQCVEDRRADLVTSRYWLATNGGTSCKP